MVSQNNYELLTDTRKYVLFLHKYIYNEEILTILADLLAEDDAVVDYTIHMDDYSINLEFGVGKIDNDTVLSTIQEFFNTEEVQEKIEDTLIDLESGTEYSSDYIETLQKTNEEVCSGVWNTIIIIYDIFDYITSMSIQL